MKKYNITEIFYSIQGEGFHAGTPAIFIRFAGCNLRCHFCDTDFSVKEVMTFEQIYRRIEKFPAKFVILTGGEPTLQVDNEFVNALQEKGYFVAMETNGTRFAPIDLNWITVSPKLPGNKFVQVMGNELKIVWDGQLTEDYLKDFECMNFRHFFIQPMSMKNTDEVIDLVKRNPKWKISTQLQKIWRID